VEKRKMPGFITVLKLTEVAQFILLPDYLLHKEDLEFVPGMGKSSLSFAPCPYLLWVSSSLIAIEYQMLFSQG
jgi:hypothetical protein